MKDLIITEKPSVARDLAKNLGVFEKQDNSLVSDQYIITWAVGHLLELAEPQDYDKGYKFWTLEKLPILPKKFELKPILKSKKQLDEVLSCIRKRGIENIINACDAGREGELIFRNLIEYSKSRRPIKRLWLSSMTSEAIKKGFNDLKDSSHFDSLGEAAKCRSHADWMIGINATRAITRRCGDLFSIGRVQTPTLSILVEREKQIQEFQSRSYYELFALFEQKETKVVYEGHWFQKDNPSSNINEIASKKEAEKRIQKIQNKEGVIEHFSVKKQKQNHPLLFDLTELQREANKRFGYTASHTLSIAQKLYEAKKLITYPRTDSRYLPTDMVAELPKILKTLSKVTLYEAFASKSLDHSMKFTKRVVDDSKVGDHFALIPTTKKASLSTLREDEKKIYDLIVRRFLSIFFPAAEYQETSFITNIAEELFETKERILIKPGYREIYGESTKSSQFVGFKNSLQVNLQNTTIEEKETKPPSRFNEATLLSAMQGAGKLITDEELQETLKEKGIGTPATRAQIIERLIKVGYCERAGKDLVPTEKGMYLIKVLSHVQLEALISPELTGSWERKLLQIEDKKLTSKDFHKEMSNFTEHIVDQVKQADFDSLEGGEIGICPICGSTITERTSSCKCTNPECSFSIAKKIKSCRIPTSELIALLEHKKTTQPLWFLSGKGKNFEAYLLLTDEGKIEFEFIDYDKIVDDTPFAQCPKCQSDMIEKVGYYGCTDPNCDFQIRKIILSQPISKEDAKDIIEKGETKKLTQFWSLRKRKKFSARLKLEKDTCKIVFDFRKDPGEIKKRKKKS
ncbi:MAG TPA: DNA topoisomerase 3 [Caldisericia bacterium]|nr:DNA topoisomerase 3 [Caldisericia bacterium]